MAFNPEHTASGVVADLLVQVVRTIEERGNQEHLVKLKEFLEKFPENDFSIMMTRGSVRLALNWPAVPQISQLGQHEYLTYQTMYTGLPQLALFNYRCGKGQIKTVILDENLNIVK